MRWGELTGLARTNTHLGGLIRIHPDLGALHEVGGKLVLGPPQTPDSARDVHLPLFLIKLLRQILDSHDHQQVFTGALGGCLRRSNFNRRTWTPAVGGDPEHNLPPVIDGMHFHDLRHTHKTWLIEDDIPEIAQAKRLGHRLPGIRGVYSHVTPAMQQRITEWTSNNDGRPTGPATCGPSPDHPTPRNPNNTAGRRTTRRPGPINANVPAATDHNRPSPGAGYPAGHRRYRATSQRNDLVLPICSHRKERQANSPLPRFGNGPADLGFCWWAILGLNQ